jgi:hypothetical protein
MAVPPASVVAPSRPIDPTGEPLESAGLFVAVSLTDLLAVLLEGAAILRLWTDWASCLFVEPPSRAEVSSSKADGAASVMAKRGKLYCSIHAKRACHNTKAWTPIEARIDNCSEVNFIVHSRQLNSSVIDDSSLLLNRRGKQPFWEIIPFLYSLGVIGRRNS